VVGWYPQFSSEGFTIVGNSFLGSAPRVSQGREFHGSKKIKAPMQQLFGSMMQATACPVYGND
jgi:hypothetical protein